MSKGGRPKAKAKRRHCFALYRKYGTLAEVSRKTGIDQSTLSRWKSEEDWDGRIASLKKSVGEGMHLDKLLDEQEDSHAIQQFQEEMDMLRFLLIEGISAYKEGNIKFEKMSDLRGVLKDYIDLKRQLSGHPTEHTETTVNLNIGGGDLEKSITSLLKILAASAEDAANQKKHSSLLPGRNVDDDLDAFLEEELIDD